MMHGAGFIAEKSARASRESQNGGTSYTSPRKESQNQRHHARFAIPAERPYIPLYDRSPRLDIDAVSELEN
jgi:hypothetical protein